MNSFGVRKVVHFAGAIHVQSASSETATRARLRQVSAVGDQYDGGFEQSRYARELDCNREKVQIAGAALMEIVTEPTIRSGVEAMCFVRELAATLRHIGSCNAEMQKAELRVDANVSVQRADGRPSPPVEVKNINSARHVRVAIGEFVLFTLEH